LVRIRDHWRERKYHADMAAFRAGKGNLSTKFRNGADPAGKYHQG
jgi:hypothetical protein